MGDREARRQFARTRVRINQGKQNALNPLEKRVRLCSLSNYWICESRFRGRDTGSVDPVVYKSRVYHIDSRSHLHKLCIRV